MHRIESIVVMHARDRVTWLVIPWSILGAGFTICLFITLAIDALTGGDTPVYTGAIAVFYFVTLVTGFGAVTRTLPFAL